MAAGICVHSRVSHPTLTVSQHMRAWNFTDEESKDKMPMKRVVRISKQITAQLPPLAVTFTVPPAASLAKARMDLCSVTDGATEGSAGRTDRTKEKTNGTTKETSQKRKRDAAVLHGQKRV